MSNRITSHFSLSNSVYLRLTIQSRLACRALTHVLPWSMSKPSPPRTTLPLHDQSWDDRHSDHHACSNASSLPVARFGQQLGEPITVLAVSYRRRNSFHLNIPERPDETPDRTDEGDENPNTGSVGPVAVDRVSDHHSGDDLVTHRTNTNTNQRGDVPRVPGIVQLNQEDRYPDDTQRVAKVTQPEAVLGLRVAPIQLAAPHIHPRVRHAPADLLADDSADDDGDHLQAILLRIEPEELGEELRDLDRDHDARPHELHRVSASGNHDTWVRSMREGLDKVVEGQRGRIDAAEVQVLLLEGRRLGLVGGGGGGLRLGGFAGTDVTRLGAEKEIEDKLETIDLGCEDSILALKTWTVFRWFFPCLSLNHPPPPLLSLNP